MVNAFCFNGVREAFHWGIVPAIAFLVHRRSHIRRGEGGVIGLRGLLASSVRIVHQAGRRPLTIYRHPERLEGSLGMQSLTHGPANELARAEIEIPRQV